MYAAPGQGGEQSIEEGIAAVFVLIDQYRRCSGEFVHVNGEAIIAAFAFILGVSTTLLWWSARRLWRATEETVRLARKDFIATHRPHVIVRSIRGPFEDPQAHQFIWVDIVNVGETPAIITEFGGDLARRNEKGDWAVPGYDSGFKKIRPLRLISGQRHFFTVKAKNSLTREEHWDDFADTHELCAIGEIRYRDDNGVVRETGFFRIYDNTRKRFIPAPEEGDYAD